MNVTVELRNGGMEAVALLGAGVSDSALAAESALEQLMKMGPTKLPDIGSVARAIEAAGKHGEVVIANGSQPQHGISAQLFPAFPVKDTPPPEEGVNPIDLYFANVAYPGDIVMRKTPASDGIPGMTLLGTSVPAKPGADVPVRIGGGMTEDGSGQVFRATTYGVVLFHRGVLSVQEALAMGEDRMEATVSVLPDRSRDESSQVDKIIAALREVGIVRGIDRDAIANGVKQAIKTGRPVHGVVAARGQPAVDSHEAEYKVVIDLEKKALKELEGGRVDYREKDAIKNVNQGEVIAEVVPAEKPVPGFRIDGSAINPKTVHVETLKPGQGVVTSEDGTKIMAEFGGMILVKGGRINVVSEYVIQGDVDIKTGNIRAAGIVKINGSVTAGFIVHAGRDLTVGGDVWEAEVSCDQDIKVFGAITAGSKVRSKGDISARFIQDSFVENDGDVEVALSITASEIYSKGKVKAVGGQGLIVGGIVNATLGVEARTIGTPTSRAHIAVGLDLRVIKEMEEIRKALPPLQEELGRLHQSLGREFLKDPQKALLALPPTLRKNKLDVLKAMKDIQMKMSTFTARMAELEEALKEQKEAVITVLGDIHAGTEITIGRVRGTVSETIRRVTIHLDKENNCIAYRKM